jgi:hypothetical protein
MPDDGRTVSGLRADGAEVLSFILGFTGKQIDELRDQGVLSRPMPHTLVQWVMLQRT